MFGGWREAPGRPRCRDGGDLGLGVAGVALVLELPLLGVGEAVGMVVPDPVERLEPGAGRFSFNLDRIGGMGSRPPRL
jgi:hypothetical protein